MLLLLLSLTNDRNESRLAKIVEHTLPLLNENDRLTLALMLRHREKKSSIKCRLKSRVIEGLDGKSDMKVETERGYWREELGRIVGHLQLNPDLNESATSFTAIDKAGSVEAGAVSYLNELSQDLFGSSTM